MDLWNVNPPDKSEFGAPPRSVTLSAQQGRRHADDPGGMHFLVVNAKRGACESKKRGDYGGDADRDEKRPAIRAERVLRAGS